jgi:hypothetical protein
MAKRKFLRQTHEGFILREGLAEPKQKFLRNFYLDYNLQRKNYSFIKLSIIGAAKIIPFFSIFSRACREEACCWGVGKRDLRLLFKPFKGRNKIPGAFLLKPRNTFLSLSKYFFSQKFLLYSYF